MPEIESHSWPPAMTRPHADRPLLGMTILLVEDSKYFSDAVRLMAIRSGARLRRADCVQSALKHVRLYRPDAILLDIGLPDDTGLSLLATLRKHPSTPPIIAMSGDETTAQQALDAGAHHFLAKPFFDLAVFQQVILSVLPQGKQKLSFCPRLTGQLVQPDRGALREDFATLYDMLQAIMKDENTHKLQYAIQFSQSLAFTSQDSILAKTADTLAQNRHDAIQRRKIISEIIDQLETRLTA